MFTSGPSPVAALLERYDVACLLYDQSDRTSFQSAAQLFVSIVIHVPIGMVFILWAWASMNNTKSAEPSPSINQQ